MATRKNVLGNGRPTSGDLVGINLTTARHLARALTRVAEELAADAADALAAAHGVGVVAVPAARLSAVARWAEGEARDLHLLVERLERLDGGPVRWAGGTDVAFAHPLLGHRWGSAIVAAIEAGDLRTARLLLGKHGDDPVVATVLVDGLGVDGVLRLLHVGHHEWARTGDAADDRRAVVLAVSDALAVAGRNGTTSISMEALAAGAERIDVPVATLSLLFVGGARFPTEMLRGAVATIVAPLNARVQAQPGLGVGPWMIPAAGAPLDARVVVLDAVARDRRAAMQAIGSADLDQLLPGAIGHLDGGVALARVLLAATIPVDHLGVPVDGPLTTLSPVDTGLAGVNAQRVIEWIGEHRDAPLAVQAEVGRLAAPWIGSFRSPGLDAVVRRHLPLDEALARSFLTYGQARDGAGADLQAAAWTWASAELHHLAGPGFDGGGFDAIGSVLGTVTITGLDADIDRAAAEDDRLRRQSDLWHRATDLVLDRLPSPGRQLAEAVSREALDRALPVGDHELRLWRDGRDAAVLQEHLALDYLAASTLWARRADNHALVRPPARLLIDPDDPDQGLVNPLTLDAAGIHAWTQWRSQSAVGRPAPLQLAGDQFLAEGRS